MSRELILVQFPLIELNDVIVIVSSRSAVGGMCLPDAEQI